MVYKRAYKGGKLRTVVLLEQLLYIGSIINIKKLFTVELSPSVTVAPLTAVH